MTVVPEKGLFRTFDASRGKNNIGPNCFNLWERWHFPRAIRNPSFRTQTS